MPPGCVDCASVNLCCAACPLYWDEQGTLAEIAPHLKDTAPWQRLLWQVKRRWVGRVKGVGVSARGGQGRR